MNGEKLFLWDIDGTLLSVGGAGERALNHAIETCFNQEANLSRVNYTGRTDRKIAVMLHDAYGFEPTEASTRSFIESYLTQLAKEMEVTRMRVLDGVREVLSIIKAQPNFYQGLLTGNLRRGAEIKLAHFDLWDYFPFGGFSDYSIERNAIAESALLEARKHTGIDFAPETCFVIGDTEHDISCGKSIGARTVALATGRISRDDLAAKAPDFLFENIDDPDAFLGALTAE